MRIVGFDNILRLDYQKAFQQLRKQVGGRLELCPENDAFCATAIAVEWIMCKGTDVVTAFLGLDSKAATEEVLVALRVISRYKPTKKYDVFAQIRDLLEEITQNPTSDRKPIVGRKIFDVESGIHVDGIVKRPRMYEPYPPELVGSSRRIVVGKHSGRTALLLKLEELGISPAAVDIDTLLTAVREQSVMRARSLTDDELTVLVHTYQAPENNGVKP